MTTIFIGGSRNVSRLPAEIKKRLQNVVTSGHHVIVGDANGADKAVQRYLHEAGYEKVTVYCSGNKPRNNLGGWTTRAVLPAKEIKGFQFYAAKDREMAQQADFGLMIWDGKSLGTILNILRLVRVGKMSVLFNVPEKAALNIKTLDQWESFLGGCTSDLRAELRSRATSDEWGDTKTAQADLLSLVTSPSDASSSERKSSNDSLVGFLNSALAAGNATRAIELLVRIASNQGTSSAAKELRWFEESFPQDSDSGGYPEFAAIIRLFRAVGLRLQALAASDSDLPATAHQENEREV